METVLNFSDPFTWVFYGTVMIGMGMTMFANAGVALLGVLILFMNTLILQSNLEEEANKRFVYEAFKQGHSIECGLWRGTRTIADPANGWILVEGQFIKGDTVLNDAGLCSVRGKEFPSSMAFEPLIFFLFSTALSLLTRLGIRAGTGLSYWSGKRVIKSTEKTNPQEVNDARS